MTSPKDMYLILYNTLCCAGWAVVLVSAVHTVFTTSLFTDAGLVAALASVYAGHAGMTATALQISQTAAIMEIVHAATALVRSPVSVTFLQVSSRIVALVALVLSPAAQCTCTRDW